MSEDQPDREEIARFVRATIPSLPTEGQLALRGIEKGGSVAFTEYIDLEALDYDAIVERLFNLSRRGADREALVAVSPATFKPGADGALKAGEANVRALLAMTVELDERPAKGLRSLREVFGEPDLVVRSGGKFVDPDTSDIEDRLHAYFIFERPVAGETDLNRAKKVKQRLTSLTGGDRSNNALSHLLRLPGSVHFKAEPRLCRIVGGSLKSW